MRDSIQDHYRRDKTRDASSPSSDRKNRDRRRSKSRSQERHRKRTEDGDRRKDRHRETSRERLERRADREERRKDKQDHGHHALDVPGGSTEKFVWHKKERMDAKLSTSERENKERYRRMEAEKELEKVQQRKMEREQRMADRDLAMIRSQNEREAAEHGEWQEKEDTFWLHNMRMRANFRLKEQRPHPIDILLLYVTSMNNDVLDDLVDLPVQEPHRVIERLDLPSLEELRSLVLSFVKLEAIQKHQKEHTDWSMMNIDVDLKNPNESNKLPYWHSVLTCVEENLKQQRHQQQPRPIDLPESVHDEIHSLLKEKKKEELSSLLTSVEQKLRQRDIDSDYWTLMRESIIFYQARCHLQEIASTVRDYFAAWRKKHLRKVERSLEAYPDKNEYEENGHYMGNNLPPQDAPVNPFATTKSDLDAKETHLAVKNVSLEEGETLFSDEVQLDSSSAMPSSSGLVKPRYVNKVMTGFDWNKYNQTHYDKDNPPPKTVFGYKFNLYYPQLKGGANAPTFHIEKDPESEDGEMALLRFKASPPYQDVVFRILRREWDMIPRHGFRSSFDRGVLQLHFKFKRYRYRR